MLLPFFGVRVQQKPSRYRHDRSVGEASNVFGLRSLAHTYTAPRDLRNEKKFNVACGPGDTS
jgi:hypothetical protein